MNHRISPKTIAARLLPAMAVMLLTGCASIGPKPYADIPGDAPAEVATLAAAVAENPRDPLAHLELARAWDRAAGVTADGDGYRQLAATGYRSALNLAPNDYLANMLAGRNEFTSGRYAAAQSLFATAILAAPDDATAALAFATASYQAGDAPLAALAAERAAQLAPQRHEPLRLLALARAANGDAAGSGKALQQLEALGAAADVAPVRTRAAVLLRTSGADQPIDDGASRTEPVREDNQVSVDVAIILSQNSRRDRVGFNLLDGLRAQYSYNDQTQESRTGGVGVTQRTILQAISVPALTYNLNIFNQSGQFYQAVARPTLTAFRGETSEFFIGRTSNIPVSGVNFSQLERVDIGISMKVTPIEIDGERVKVRIETGRSFASNEPAGTFSEALTLFRQNVAATAEVRFGETLVLSGLSESVDDAGMTKTPGLGDTPIVGMAFNARSKFERRDAALVLLTPSRVTTLPSGPWARGPAVERLIKLWGDVVDPASNGNDVAARLSRSRIFTRAHPGDSPLSWTDGGGLRALGSLLLSSPL